MNIQELKLKSSEQLITQAEELGIENASTLRKQEILFAILKKVAEKEEITGAGVLQLLQDGFGFLRAMESNYLPGPDDIYVSPSQIRKFGLRTGDTVEGPVRAPKEGERYFALLQVSKINFEEPDKSRHKIAFDNLTPLYPDKQLVMESNKMITSFLCSVNLLAFSITISATATCLCAGSSKVELITSPFTVLCISVTSSGRSSINNTIR